MLGTACNLHCEYCCQKTGQKNMMLPNEINPDIFEFIEECGEENGEGYPVRLHFYGGEPLLYFDKIKEIVGKTSRMNTEYSMVSNGKAITQEMVDFFNEHELRMITSWDGFGSLDTRHYDVNAENKDLLFQVNHFGYSFVVSAKNYPMDIIRAYRKADEEYRKFHDHPLGFGLDFIFDTGIANTSLIDNLSEKRLENEGKAAVDLLASEIAAGKVKDIRDDYALSWIADFIGDAREFYSDDGWKKDFVIEGVCENGKQVLNMDLSGKLYECHNVFEPIGDIYSNFWSVEREIIKRDNNRKIGHECTQCPAFLDCFGGCKLHDIHSEEKRRSCRAQIYFRIGMLKEAVRIGLLKDPGIERMEAFCESKR